MNEKHVYDYTVDPSGYSAGSAIVRMVGKDKTVLELGAGPGAITKPLKEHGSCEVTALELDADALPMLSNYAQSVVQADLNDPDWVKSFQLEKYEVIVAGDVLEHLSAPLKVLQAAKGLLTPGGSVVLSLPNIAHNSVIACLLNNDFPYNDWGLLDKTHIRFFAIQNMQALVEDAGFCIDDCEFIVRTVERTEFSEQLKKLSPSQKEILTDNSYGDIYQVVLKIVKKEDATKNLDIMSLSVPSAPPLYPKNLPMHKKLLHILRALIVPHLSFKNRTRLGNFAYKLGIRL